MDTHWDDVQPEDYACDPVISTPSDIVSVTEGSSSSLICSAKGDPLPDIQWVADRKVLSNMSTIGDTMDHYTVVTVQNSSGVFSTLHLGVYSESHDTTYTCIATNPAATVQKDIQIVIGTDNPLDVIVKSGPQFYILMAVGIVLIFLILLLIVVVLCCWWRRRPLSRTPHTKVNGNTGGDHGNVMVVAPSNGNPVIKPARQYEQLPQKDFEMTTVGSTHGDFSAHQSFEEPLYGSVHQPIYVGARLAPVDEEAILEHYPPSPYLVPQAPSPSLTIQSNLTQTTTSQYPDILDNVRVPRTISPTQMSYQSLVYPPLGQDYRFSYAHPLDYSAGHPSEYSRTPVAYSTPQHHRPGYVTLPRRPRAPSWSGVPSPSLLIASSPTAPTKDTVYDTLGPRTTADGTSTTDLTRPGSYLRFYH